MTDEPESLGALRWIEDGGEAMSLHPLGHDPPPDTPWHPLTDGLEGCSASGLSPSSPIWNPGATREARCALSLHERGTYVARLARGWTLDAGNIAERTEVPGTGVTLLGFRGHAGEARWTLRGPCGDRAIALFVRSRWMDDLATWGAMLDDLADLGLEAWSDIEGATFAAFRWSEGSGDDFASLLFLRRALDGGYLARALEQVTRSPIASVEGVHRAVPLARSSRARPDYVATASAGRSIHEVTVVERGPGSSLDTPENRFVVACLDALCHRGRDLCALFPLGRHRHGELAGRVARGLVKEREKLRCWTGVVRPGVVAHESPSLHHRGGYREIATLWWSLTEVAPRLLPRGDDGVASRDSPSLYERWCGIEVARALGFDPRAMLASRAEVRRSDGATLWSQRSYGDAGSYSLNFRPDFTLEAAGRRLLLDAKYRMDPARGTLPSDELAAMHAYRDAIAGAWGAVALFPGEHRDGRWFTAPREGGVGALALRPTTSAEARERQRGSLRALVAQMLRSDAVP